jgi:Predicted transcriptional regulators
MASQVISMDDIVERFETEVKRGMMQVAIMCLLEQERYGYDIIKSLKDGGLGVEEGTLYPILRRLEDEKLLSSRWETTGPRPRKYYVITDYGKHVRTKLLESLRAFSMAIETLERQTEGGN